MAVLMAKVIQIFRVQVNIMQKAHKKRINLLECPKIEFEHLKEDKRR